MIAAMASFSVNGAFGQAPTGASLGNVADQPSQKAEQQLAAAKNPDPRQPPPGGNPLWGTPMSALSVTRDRPIFSGSRRRRRLPCRLPKLRRRQPHRNSLL